MNMMKNTKAFHRVAMISLLACAFSIGTPTRIRAQGDQPDDILIIANKNAPIDTISEEDIQAIFLRIRRVIGSGSTVVPVNARRNTPLREEFRKRILQLSPEKEGRYWEDKKISLGLTAPPEFSNPLKAVFKLRNSIGYIFRSEYREGVVKVIAVVRREASK